MFHLPSLKLTMAAFPKSIESLAYIVDPLNPNGATLNIWTQHMAFD